MGVVLALLSFMGFAYGGDYISTSSGQVLGHLVTPNVNEYLGIPYALPPLDGLRFAAPKKIVAGAPLNASTFMPDCPSLPSPEYSFPGGTPQQERIEADFAEQNHTPQNENCLGLNIWAKNHELLPQTLKPVMVWIYGGRFAIGGSNTPLYDGRYLASSEGVVVVTVNYRVNIFGFPGSPADLNLGLLDQRLALEWVRDNIAQFGGDPLRITIFGQSAGAVSVDYFQYRWHDDPIIAGSISMSGVAHSFLPNSQKQSRDSFHAAASILGCRPPADILQCMRSHTTNAILSAVATLTAGIPQTSGLQNPIFQPTVDEVLVFSDYGARAVVGKTIRKPYLLGNTDYEAGYYQLVASQQNKTISESDWDLFNLEAFTCAVALESKYLTEAGGPVWRYRYFGSWPNLALDSHSGAYHGSDISMVFGVAEQVSGLPNTPAEDTTIRAMMHAWATFARDPAEGLLQLGWPSYDPNERTLVAVAREEGPVFSFISPQSYDNPCVSLGGYKDHAQGAF